MADHPHPEDMGHGYGETAEQHAHHADVTPIKTWGLVPGSPTEAGIFYTFATLSWMLLIAAAVLGSYYSTTEHGFIATISTFFFFSWAAWWMTAAQMAMRASWIRDEGDLPTRRAYLYLAVRLNRLMMPTWIVSLATFIVAYVRRHDTDDLANWLLFLIIFIANIVCCVMNAYNNITWESDRLEYEEGQSPYGKLAIIGIPGKPKKKVKDYED